MISMTPIGRTLKNASRLRTIVGVFARHGFHNVAERIQLGKFLIERLSASSEIDKLSIAERIRISFEELGPTFVKLGQLLATRPDLVPEDYVLEFAKLHDRVLPLPYETVEQVLREEYGQALWSHFESIEKEPLGSASIAQVHKARLKTGEVVVIKVQRPGILTIINDDLNVLYFLADLLNTYVPETRPFNPRGIVDEFFRTLELETNFIVEANNIRRFTENFKNEPQVKIPFVHLNLATERVLVLEALNGVPLSSDSINFQASTNSDLIIRTGLRAYLKMVFNDGLFHGDLHAGNFFVLPNNVVGLIDFGVVGRLNKKTQSAIANMLLALSEENYERMAYEYIDLAPFTDKVNIDLFAKDLRELIAPYYGLTLKNVNLGKLLMSSSAVAAKHHLTMPTELMLFFKSIVAIEGLGNRLMKDFDFLNYSLTVAKEMMKSDHEGARIKDELSQVLRESRSFLNTLPRQLNFLVRKLNSPEHAFRLHLENVEGFRRTFEKSFNLLFLGIIIGSLILSASILVHAPSENLVAGLPLLSFIGYLLACGLGVVAFINYLRKR